MSPAPPLTDPDERITRIRFFTRKFRSGGVVHIMDVSVMTALRMVRLGIVKGDKYAGAPHGRSRPKLSRHIARERSRSVR